eukprot:scaffold4589_cov79-Skeletonema_menzelii.AAC.18
MLNMNMNMTDHSLNCTLTKNYLELQDEVGIGLTITLDDTLTKKYLELQDQENSPQPQACESKSHKELYRLAGMIKKRDWDLLSIELKVKAHEELKEGSGLLLHLELRFDAPLLIVSQLTHGIPTGAGYLDGKSRLPLHVAIRKISHLSIISHVLMLNPRACTSVDDQGSTPLHTCFDEKVMHAFKPSQFREVVRLLVSNSPESLEIEDRNSQCPIELALLSDAPLKTILFMQCSKHNYLCQKYHPLDNASCFEKSIVLKDMPTSHISGRIGVTYLLEVVHEEEQQVLLMVMMKAAQLPPRRKLRRTNSRQPRRRKGSEEMQK